MEEVLASHPAVSECTVIGVSDDLTCPGCWPATPP
jgi:acyl-coenzyme A synthetase/AMP-(fatty) acid ligase